MTATAWEVVVAVRHLARSGLVVGTVGNVSVRTGSSMLVTPTRTSYALMRAEDVVRIDLRRGPAAHQRPSREWRLHAEIYEQRADVDAVVHTHSTHATAWSFLDRPLEPAIEETAYYEIGPIRTAAHAPAASQELAEGTAFTLGRSKAVLLGRHGVVACGATLMEAVAIAEVVEHHADIAWLLRGRAPGRLVHSSSPVAPPRAFRPASVAQ